MKKTLSLWLFTAVLTGCGGSSSDKSNTNIVAENNLPKATITGVYNAKAGVSSSATIDMHDEDGDSLTATILNTPEWITYTVTNNQLIVTTEPDLLAIGSHEFDLKISDGKSTSDYKINFEVADNKTIWGSYYLSKEEIFGIWESKSSNLSITFSSGDTGVWIKDKKAHGFNFKLYQEILDLKLGKEHCYNGEVCGYDDQLTIRTVAKDDTRMRLVITDFSGDETAYTFVKNNENAFSAHSYVGATDNFEGMFFTLNELKISDNTPSHLALFATSKLGDNATENTRFIANPIITSDGNGKLNNPILIEEFESVRFDKYSGGHDYLKINLTLDKISLIGQTDDFLFVEFDVSAAVVDGLDSGIEDYRLLADALKPKTNINALRRIEKTDVPELEMGKPYLTRLMSKIGQEHLGSSKFELSSATKGKLFVTSPDDYSESFMPFSYTIENDQLTVEIDGKKEVKDFYTLPNGDLGITVSFNDSDVKSIYVIVPASYQPTRQDYIGKFYHGGSSEYYVMSINENERGGYYAQENYTEIDPIKFNENGSVSFFHHYYCEYEEQSFDDCLAYAKAHTRVNLHNVNFVWVDDNYYYATYYRHSGNTFFESVRRYKKIVE